MGQGVANGGIDKKFFTSRRNGENVHDGIPRVLNLKGVDVVIVVVGGGSCERGKLRNGNLSVGTESSFFEDLGELRTQRGVEKGDATTNFAAQGVVKGVVMQAMRTVE